MRGGKKNTKIVLFIILFCLLTTSSILILDLLGERLFNSEQKITGRASTSTNANALISLCINNMPNISTSACSRTALIGILYSCTILNYDTDINQTYNYTADVDLFVNQTLNHTTESGVFPINLTTGKASFTANASQEGSYFINVTSYDSSNCANNQFSDSFNLTIRQPHCGDGYCIGSETCGTCPQDCGECPSPSPSGGGGGSGGGVIAPTQTTQLIKYIPPYTLTEIKILNANVALIKLELEVNNELKNVEFNILGPASRNALPVPELSGIIYQYFEVAAKNLPPEYIVTLNHILRIPKNWLAQNKVSDAMITYYQYKDSSWQALHTEKTSEDTNYIYYNAQGKKAFSYFAVGIAGFSTNTDLVKVTLKQGEAKEQYIAFSNKGGGALEVNIDVQGLSDMINIDEPTFLLDVGETKTIKIKYHAPAGKEPGIYTGQVLLNSEANKQIINNIIEVESVEVIFDLSLDIPLDYKDVLPGQTLRFAATAYNIKDVPPAKTIIFYDVKDAKGNIVYTEKEERTIDKQLSWTKEIILPKELQAGGYVLGVQIRYGATTGTASEQFKIVKDKSIESPRAGAITKPDYITYVLILLSAVLIIGCVVLYSRYRFHIFEAHQAKEMSGIKKTVKHEHEKLENITLKRARIVRQLQLLDHSVKQGYIRKSVYESSADKLKKELGKLKK